MCTVGQQTSRSKGTNSGSVSRILRPQKYDSLLLEVDANLGCVIGATDDLVLQHCLAAA